MFENASCVNATSTDFAVGNKLCCCLWGTMFFCCVIFFVVAQPCFFLTSDIFSGLFCWGGKRTATVALSIGICSRAPVCRLGDMLLDGFIWVRRIHVCVRTTGWPVSSRECKMMSCDFTCPAVIYLTPVSVRFCLASGCQFAIVQEETGWEWALNIDFKHRRHNDRAYFQQSLTIQHAHNILYYTPISCIGMSEMELFRARC